MQKFLQTHEYGSKTYPNLWDTAKAGLRFKFITVNTYINKKKISSKQYNSTTQGTRKVPKLEKAKELLSSEQKLMKWKEKMQNV